MYSIREIMSGKAPTSFRVHVLEEGRYLFKSNVKNLDYTIGGVKGTLIMLKKGDYVIEVKGPRGYPFTLTAAPIL